MKNIVKFTALAAVAFGLSSPAMAERTPEQKATYKMKVMDGNGDGEVTMEEFTAYRTKWVEEKGKDAKMLNPKSMERAFARHDQNGDGKIVHAEVVAMAEDKGE